MKSSFSSYHPLVNFTYYLLVLLFTMFFMHPACLLISLLCAAGYAVYLGGRKTLGFQLKYLLPLLLLTAVLNPAFNHQGATILTYLPSGNPLTLESIVYGFASAVMLAAVVAWFQSYNLIMTSDKFIYLFGRIIPSLSLVLSMTLRFVPKFKAQLKLVSDAQRCVGRDVSAGPLSRRLRTAMKIFSIMVTWALENAMETADSMKSRGYGLPGRTAFSIYRFDRRDRRMLAFLLLCAAAVGGGALSGGLRWRYFPTMQGTTGGEAAVFCLLYLALCLAPLAADLWADRRWKLLRRAG